jgi:Na+/proline symporter
MTVPASLLLLLIISITYTLCGGMKAVIITDCIQSFVMLGGLIVTGEQFT